MEKGILVLIVAPLMGHLTQSLEMAKLILERNNQLSIAVLIMKLPTDPEGTNKIQSITATCNVERLHFHRLPSPTPEDISVWSSTTDRGTFFSQLAEFQKVHVREVICRIKGFSGFIVDSTNTTMMDVADEFGVPTYVFFTSGAALLGLLFHFQTLQDEKNQEICEMFKRTNQLLSPSFVNPIPISSLPTAITTMEIWSTRIINSVRRLRKARGIMVNTFAELETVSFSSFLMDSSYGNKSRLPPIYPVGPLLSRFQTGTKYQSETAMDWLNAQPENSVVFLCFGSIGSFHLEQVKEIAYGLEQSGHRFLWVLRQPPTDKVGFPTEYENLEHVLPEGFLNRSASIGKVVGWVPQLAVLSHSAVGGFVSHCGWNSILESIWCGVPIATWPLTADQQLNAFQLVKELRMAVEISLDYNEENENQAVVRAEQVEKGIRELMDGENEIRKRVKEFSEKSRGAMKEGGSSYLSFENVIQSIRTSHSLGPNTPRQKKQTCQT